MDDTNIWWKQLYIYDVTDGVWLDDVLTIRIGKCAATAQTLQSNFQTIAVNGSFSYGISEGNILLLQQLMEVSLSQPFFPDSINDTDLRGTATYNAVIDYLPSLSLRSCPPLNTSHSYIYCISRDDHTDNYCNITLTNTGAYISAIRLNGTYNTFNATNGLYCGVGGVRTIGDTVDCCIPFFCMSSDGILASFNVFKGTGTIRWVVLSELNTDRVMNFVEAAETYTPPEPSIDPYAPGGYSGTGGGGGGQNFASVPIGRAPLPTLSFADTGFCRIYNPTLTQLQDLADYMWTDDTFLQTLLNHAKQLLEDPMQSIISLSMVPVQVPQGNAENVKVLFIPTGVYMAPVTNQFVEVDCGTLSLNVEDQYGAALDFNPYTKIDLYLPYIGQVSIDTDEVMYKTISCKYNVDVVTGACVASIATGSGADETVLYQFSGHCSIEMPLTSADFSSWIASIINAAKMVTAVAAGAAGHPEISAGLMALPSPGITGKTSTIKQGGGWEGKVTQTERNPSTGRQIAVGTRATERTNRPEISTSIHEVTPPSFGELAAKGAVNTVDSVMASKIQVQHAGGFSGNSGYLAAVRRPYAIIKRPNQCYPEHYASYKGYPSMIYMSLGDCTGYTEVHDIHLTGISATNPELGELAQLLKTGVIL